MSGGAQQAGTTTSTQAPPAYMYPYIGTALGQAGNLLATGGPQYYPGQQVAAFNPTQQAAMQKTVTTGLNGSPALTAAQGFDTTLLNSGGGSNPYLDAMFKQAAGATQGQLESEFGGAGRNVDAAAPLQAQTDTNLATQIYGNAYQNDIQNALQAGNQAQNLYQTKLGGEQAALGVGNQVQGQSQALIDSSKQAYGYNQNLPWQNLSMYEQMVGGVQPGMSQSNPYFNNPTANLLGEGAMGASIYSALAHGGAKGAAAAA